MCRNGLEQMSKCASKVLYLHSISLLPFQELMVRDGVIFESTAPIPIVVWISNAMLCSANTRGDLETSVKMSVASGKFCRMNEENCRMSWTGIDIGDFIDFYIAKAEMEWEKSRVISGEEGGKLLEFEKGSTTMSLRLGTDTATSMNQR